MWFLIFFVVTLACAAWRYSKSPVGSSSRDFRKYRLREDIPCAVWTGYNRKRGPFAEELPPMVTEKELSELAIPTFLRVRPNAREKLGKILESNTPKSFAILEQQEARKAKGKTSRQKRTARRTTIASSPSQTSEVKTAEGDGRQDQSLDDDLVDGRPPYVGLPEEDFMIPDEPFCQSRN